MAAKKSKKSGKSMGKKEMKKTKGGILVGMLLPAVQKVQPGSEKFCQNNLAPEGGGSFTCIPEQR